jgi:RNA polymerase sigma-70 factor (ECF subfamily)
MVDSALLHIAFLGLALAPEKELDRKALAEKIKAGDHQAFEHFFDRHYDPLLHFLMSKGTEREVAKDLIQKAFVYIWEHRQQIDPQKSLRAYIFKIAYTRMLNHFRDNKKFNNNEAVPNSQTNLTPEDAAQAKDLRHAIDLAISHMPEKRGTVFRLCFIEDFTYREAAETLEVSKKTIENHMGRALKDMRQSLKQFQ